MPFIGGGGSWLAGAMSGGELSPPPPPHAAVKTKPTITTHEPRPLDIGWPPGGGEALVIAALKEIFELIVKETWRRRSSDDSKCRTAAQVGVRPVAAAERAPRGTGAAQGRGIGQRDSIALPSGCS